MVIADVEDRENVGMVQRRRGPRLLRKTLQAVRVAGKRCGQDLDGDGAVEAGVMGAVDLAHSACADRCLNFIRTEVGSSGDVHYKDERFYLVRCAE